MGNTIPIKYHGETLACLDPSQVEAIIPFNKSIEKKKSINGLLNCIVKNRDELIEVEKMTRIFFKDGTSICIKMPFLEFTNEYP